MEKESEFQVDALFDKLKAFFIKNHSWFFLGILFIAAIIRFKYMTVNSALWWDEADYLNIAKHYALGTDNLAAPWRARAMAILWVPLYKLGGTEWTIRFVHQLFSITGVYLTYLVGKKFFNKNVGLIAAFFMSFFWLHIFWSTRIGLGVEGLVIFTTSALLFWEGYVKKKKISYVVISAALMAWGLFAYESVGFLIPFLGIYLLFTERLKFLKNKRFWIFVATALIVATPFLVWNYVDFHDDFSKFSPGKAFIFSLYPRFGRTYEADWVGFKEGDEIVEKASIDRPFSESVNKFLYFFKDLPNLISWPIFLLFVFGLSYFINLILGFDIFLKRKSSKLNKDFYVFWWLLFIILIFSIWMAASGFAYEPRLWFSVFPVLFSVAAFGAITVYDFFKKYNKFLAVAVILIILILGAQANFEKTKSIIDNKKDTYSHIKLAGEWIKENSQKGDIITGCGLNVPFLYYSERNFPRYKDANATATDDLIRELKPKYFIMDFYDPNCHPQEYLQLHQDKIKPVKVYFYDEAQTQPIIVIFKIEYPF